MDIKTLSEKIELISKSYSTKFEINRDSDWFILKLQEELGELIQSYLMMIGQARKKDRTEEELVQDFQQEVADVFAHVLLLAKHNNIDLEKEVKEKWLKWEMSESTETKI